MVIAVFAVSVRFAFVATIERQADARLETLARAGLAFVHFAGGRFSVDRGIVRALRIDQEGLEWFDAGGKPVERQGLVPRTSTVPLAKVDRTAVAPDLITRTVEIHDAEGQVRGYVRASESAESLSAVTRALDLGLWIGALLSIGTATAGGWYLARQAVAKTEESFERLRQFSADASHELRGPIGAIANNAQLAREEAAASGGDRTRLDNIVALAADMRGLVDDLLILARAGQPITRELFLVDADAVLARVSARYAPAARATGVAFTISSTHPPPIYGNPDQIERIVMNLVENAIRHSHSGAIEIACTSNATQIRIIVKDCGVGIAPEHMPYIFDRFWRADSTRSAHGGTGLGLAIALALARRHGGNISATSKLGAGSEFSLVLPRRPAIPARA